ncbi:glycosyltransferase [Lacticaseibacillus casei]|jgi:UDP-D-galactose:(glucosyl)LPS alpha-1,6-D-galactosyltransferase|uniref:Glycosyltransferase n=1 Tax=Lacticaseibacillus huelsenbergensis TaxID=3035291 RepID=A0ABY8DR26_9LACO|nr:MULTISPECIES: glycosyltransferase [Lacticaseibacillus]MDG3060891.1 glycosyltransferase [Lacticaseibacillus sp. BCRC 81376]QVI37325.1 glycosyltransferase [Lacticaseibacillus casei]QXG59115.1 glycosyltransferase [Lacticaseibacillus casei]WFB39433.1 glycosyltransferase [Lacticaseibacillus huelsenbergensis]WFB41135.1 glycosyltransferase [Lacticaseibacillus huelsenbergensis]
MRDKEKIKTLVILPFLSGEGGTETVVNEWISHFEHSSDFEMSFLLPQGSMRDHWYPSFSKKVKVFKFAQLFRNRRSIRNLFGAIWLAFAVLFTSADEVVCLSTKLIYEVAFLKRLFHKKFRIISWIHFSLLHGQDVSLDDLQKADYHLAISTGIQQQMHDINIEASRIGVVGNPVSPTTNVIPASTDGITRFVYSGRIFVDGEKNLRELVLGLNKLNKLTKQWTLDVFGDGPDMSEFKELIAQKGIASQVTLHGWVTQPLDKLAHADCLVLTSTYEGFGMVLAEAIARGIPVISSDCPTGPADIVNDSNGYLYRPGDVSMLTEKMIAIINKEKVFNHDDLPSTVSKFYSKSYFNRLEQFLVAFSE